MASTSRYLQNCWYQVGWSEELTPQAPLVRTIIEQPLLLFRDPDGCARAIQDRCPHRFAPLSRGHAANGVVTCGYHGLAFDGSGACVANPHGAIPRDARVRAYPVLERHLGLWVWMGTPDRADPALLPDMSFIDETPAGARIMGHLPTRAHYELMSDNIMDLTHADYLHPSTLGGIMRGVRARVEKRDSHQVVIRWDSTNAEPPPAYRPAVPPGSRADIWTEVAWSPPALMILRTGAVPPGAAQGREHEGVSLHNMTPESPTHTHYFYCSVRRFQLDDDALSARLKAMLTQAFVQEDKPMLEAQQERMGERDFWALQPLLLNIDSGAVQARRVLTALIAEENSRAAGPAAGTAV